MYNNSKVAKAIRLAMMFGAAATASVSTSAFSADEAEATESVERIAITGSRIRKAEYLSNAPIASVGAEQFALTATVNTESLLNTLPQVVPGLDRTSNNPGDGTATVDLRGLGTNRTLVLVDGKRAVPNNAGGAVDINSIPTSLIQSVEVLTGGASAVYGTDAVAGVVNFILKKDFEGLTFSSGYESSEEGDAEIFNADLTIGGNFADGKGNVVFNMSFTDRGDVFQGDRSFAQTALFDDGDGGLEPGGSSGVPQTAIFSGGFGDYADSSGVIFGKDGSIRPFDADGEQNDFYNYAPVNYLQLPQERHQITALGHYELTDNMEIYGRAMFTDSRVPQQLAPTPIFQTASFTLDGNPFLSPEAQQIISDGIGEGVDTDGDGIDDTGRALLRRRLEEVGPRRSEAANTSFQLMGGIKGYFGDSNWSYDAYYQTGRVSNATAQLGNVNRDRFEQALLLDLAADPTGGTCQDPSANGSTSPCVPINIFGEGNISQGGADFLKTAVNASAIFDQDMAAITIAGDTEGLFELPGGAVGLAFGIEHREESFEFLPSQDLAAGTIAGFNGAAGLAGGFKVDEYYVEAYLPILSGVEFAELLDIELAYRTSDYSTVGSVSSYKVAGSWAPMEELRFRAGYNTAVRAPNIGELFSPSNEGFPGASDPCSAGGAVDTSQAVRDLCIATGVPANVVFSNAIDPASGQVRSVGGGDPTLKEEEADTLTVGFVITPMDNLSVSIDYFDIEIKDAIAGFGGGTNNILATCYDTSNPAGGLGGQYCNSIKRRSDGTIDFVKVGSQNVASSLLTGYDIAANYNMDLYDGTFSIDYLGTITKKNEFLPFAGGDLITCAGEFGADCGEPVPEYKHRMTFKWVGDDVVAQLVWRYVGEVKDDDLETVHTVDKISGFNYFNASTTYNFTDNYKMTFGIRNLLNEKPPVIGDNDRQANTYPSTYDVFGRAYYLNVTASF